MATAIKSTKAYKIEAHSPPERFARGWHCLGLADDYKDGKIHGINIFGTRIIIFQKQDGSLSAMDAWCPHMGADLALGRVENDSVVCKFHNWSWGCDGACNDIPYAKTIPPKARINTWELCEENQFLFVWNDPEGNAPTADVAIPHMPQCFSDEWSDWSTVKWDININCRELIDNVADMAHFGPVHGGTGTVYFANIFEAHKATQIMVGTFPNLSEDDFLTTVATYYGPAYQITHMFGQMQGVPVESILMNSHTPVDQNSFELRFGVIVKKFPGMTEEACAEMVQGYVDATNKAFGEDVEIWHNKVRVDNPLLCDSDGPVIRLRQWYDQFYQDADTVSEKLKARKELEIDKGCPDEVKPPMAHAFES